MANIRISDIIKNYVDNNTSGDFAEWTEKLELVANVQKCADKLASILPLLLEGPAFAVYKQLSDDAKGDYQKCKNELLAAFGANCFDAYDQFRGRVLQEEETVDTYLSDLKRLASLIGVSLSAAQPFIKCAFLSGLPPNVADQLKAAAEVEKLGLDGLAARARLIMATRSDGRARFAIAAGSRRADHCFTCGGRGHFARNCPSRPQGDSSQRKILCYSCGRPGHIARYCRNSDKGKERENFNGEPSSVPDVFSAPRQ